MKKNDSSWGDALAAIEGNDAVVLTLGTDRSVAGEGSDRKDIGFPGVQKQFALAVLERAHQYQIPVVLLLIHNLPCSFDDLVQPPNATYTPVAAIVDAWAPTINAPTVAASLFGKINKYGRSVLTVYPHHYQDQISLFSFDMSAAPGRSYKYYNSTPLVRFGEGLSGYSTFNVDCVGGFTDDAKQTITINCSVEHESGPAGDEVLMVFHRPSSDVISFVDGAHPLPLSALRDFDRVTVEDGGKQYVSFELATELALSFTNKMGAQALYPGRHFLDIWNGNSQNTTISLTVTTAGTQIVRAPLLP
jgi:beta-glucosidase